LFSNTSFTTTDLIALLIIVLSSLFEEIILINILELRLIKFIIMLNWKNYN